MIETAPLHRATFSSPYLTRKWQRHPKATRPRLGDCVLQVIEPGAPEYVQDAASGEICVVDLATRQKAWIETPEDLTLEEITSMIEGHFDAAAFQVSTRLWIVTC